MLAERFNADAMNEVFNQSSPPGAAAVRLPPMEDAGHPGNLSADAAHELANLMTIVAGSLEQLRR